MRSNGRSACVTSWPEEDRIDRRLTVDAVISVDGVSWAADHERVINDRDLPAAYAKAVGYLTPRLNMISGEHQVGLAIKFDPPRWVRGSKLPKAAWEEIITVAQDVAANRQPHENLGLSVWPMPASAGVRLSPLVYPVGALGAEYERALREALGKKLRGQLQRAKNLGFPVLLLLDQMPDPACNAWTMFAPEEGMLASAVSKLLSQAPGVVDAVWLRESTDHYRQLEL